MTPAPAVLKGKGRTFTLLAVTLLVITMAPAALVVLTRSKPFSPLALGIQTVENRIEGIDGPAAHIGDELVVNATKCNASGSDIGIENSSSWVSVTPGGSVIVVGSGTAFRKGNPRCQDFHYRNPMPPAVQARMRELFAQGVTRQVWRLSGLETPLAPHAVAAPWTTQDVVIVADAPQ